MRTLRVKKTNELEAACEMKIGVQRDGRKTQINFTTRQSIHCSNGNNVSVESAVNHNLVSNSSGCGGKERLFNMRL